MIVDGVVVGAEIADLRLGLGNILQVCAQSDEFEWPRLVAQHFEAMERASAEVSELARELRDFAQVSSRLGVRLFEPHVLSSLADHILTREDVPGLFTCLCIDTPSSVRMIKRDEAALWEMSEDQVFARAIENLDSLTAPDVSEFECRPGRTFWGIGGESMFTSSLLLRLHRLPQIMGRHGSIVSVPTRHTMLALPVNDIDVVHDLHNMLVITHGMERDGPGSVSKRVWWTRGGEFIEIPYHIDDEGIQVSPPLEFVKVLESLA